MMSVFDRLGSRKAPAREAPAPSSAETAPESGSTEKARRSILDRLGGRVQGERGLQPHARNTRDGGSEHEPMPTRSSQRRVDARPALPSTQHDIHKTPSYARGRTPGYNLTADYNIKAKPDSIYTEREEPNPRLELMRYQGIERVRAKLEELSKELGLPAAPRAGLSRFLFEQRTHSLLPHRQKTPIKDSLITNPAAATESDVLRRELLAEIPHRIPMTLRCGWRKSWKYLTGYLESGTYWLRALSSKLPATDAETVRRHLARTRDWQRASSSSCELRDLHLQLAALRDECTPIFRRAVAESVQRICEDIRAELDAVTHELQQERERATRRQGRGDKEEEEEGQHPGKGGEEGKRQAEEHKDGEGKTREGEEELQKEEEVAVSVEGEGALRVVALRFGGDRVTVNAFHHDKLRALYAIHSKPHRAGCRYQAQQEQGTYDTKQAALSPCDCPIDETHFARCLYVLARRYKTFIGDEAEGGAFHAAAPETTFDALREDFGVSQEQFASPFNCHFRKFCSAFPDIDVWFGSVGSFFDFEPVEGSFETGPPYTEEVMDRMADRLHELLDNSTGPLSFIVFVPQWRSPPCHAITSMDRSPYLRHHFVAPGHQHTYITGVQHTEGGQGGYRYYVVPHGTELFFLQNDAGFAKWPPTKEKIDRFKASLGIRAEGERVTQLRRTEAEVVMHKISQEQALRKIKIEKRTARRSSDGADGGAGHARPENPTKRPKQ